MSNVTPQKPVHNLEYQDKALKRFEEFCCYNGRDVLEIGSDPELRVVQLIGKRAKSVFGITNAKGHWGHNESGQLVVTDNVLAANYDARKMPFDDESFDFILSIATFEHIQGLDAALSEMYRVLRPGGTVYSSFGPIWSCAVGHHIHMNLEDGTCFRFWRDDLNPVPHYSHLLCNEDELARLIAPKYGAHIAAKIARSVYNSAHINRMMYDDYVRCFASSKFHVKHLKDLVIRPLPTDVKKELVSLHGAQNHYECGTIEIVLCK